MYKQHGGDLVKDIIIVGGGLAGLAGVYTKTGLDTVLFEKCSRAARRLPLI